MNDDPASDRDAPTDPDDLDPRSDDGVSYREYLRTYARYLDYHVDWRRVLVAAFVGIIVFAVLGYVVPMLYYTAVPTSQIYDLQQVSVRDTTTDASELIVTSRRVPSDPVQTDITVNLVRTMLPAGFTDTGGANTTDPPPTSATPDETRAALGPRETRSQIYDRWSYSTVLSDEEGFYTTVLPLSPNTDLDPGMYHLRVSLLFDLPRGVERSATYNSETFTITDARNGSTASATPRVSGTTTDTQTVGMCGTRADE